MLHTQTIYKFMKEINNHNSQQNNNKIEKKLLNRINKIRYKHENVLEFEDYKDEIVQIEVRQTVSLDKKKIMVLICLDDTTIYIQD